MPLQVILAYQPLNSMTIQSYSGVKKGDLWVILKVAAVVASPQSCNCNLSTWKLTHIYNNYNVPQLHYHHLQPWQSASKKQNQCKLASSHKLQSLDVTLNLG